jgi:hypothetical protein
MKTLASKSPILFVGAVCLLLANNVFAQRTGSNAQFSALLNAGEFVTALNLAESANDPATRDRMLVQLADAQQTAGARTAAVDTLSRISDQDTRSYAISNLQTKPLGHGVQGGGQQADFDTLIDLITSTVKPTTWDEVGGTGSIEGFPTGVLVDAKGLLAQKEAIHTTHELEQLRRDAERGAYSSDDPRSPSSFRKISLARLERETQLLAAAGKSPTEAMKTLGGLERIEYVFIYPEQNDIVLAGPAGNWLPDADGRLVSATTGRPVVLLDDLVVIFRAVLDGEGRFGCSIVPRQENLAATKSFLEESAKKSVSAGGRAAWIRKLQQHLGKQDIEIYGIDPATHAASVIVEADHHMKLVGMDIEDGVLGVESYLDAVAAQPDKLAASNVLRWWFTLGRSEIEQTKDALAWKLGSEHVRVLSENEMLTAQGKRVHTGKSDEPTARFAETFTKNFAQLQKKYPVYAEIENVFHLALAAEMIRHNGSLSTSGWKRTYWKSPPADARQTQLTYQPMTATVPKEVESVVNHRVVSKSRFIAGVSGGVTCSIRSHLDSEPPKVVDYGLMEAERSSAAPENLAHRAWWWD